MLLYGEKNGITTNTIESWATTVEEWFINHNSLYLPVSDILDDTGAGEEPQISSSSWSGAAAPIVTITNSSTGRVGVPARSMMAMITKTLQSNKANNDLMVQIADKMNTLTDIVHKLVENHTSVISTAHHTANLVPEPVSTLPEAPAVLPTVPEGDTTPEGSYVAVTQPPAAPADLMEEQLKGLCIHETFFRWYNDELHKYKFQVDNQRARDRMGRFSSLMVLLRRFLPDNTVISAKPTDPVELEQWTEQLRHLSKEVETRSNDFVNHMKHLADSELPPDQQRKRKRKITTRHYTMDKHLKKCDIDTLPVPHNVSDNATSNMYLV
jgi:hypothetical protein